MICAWYNVTDIFAIFLVPLWLSPVAKKKVKSFVLEDAKKSLKVRGAAKTNCVLQHQLLTYKL